MHIKQIIGYKTYLRRYSNLFERLKIWFIYLFWSISLVPYPDPDSQYIFAGFSRAKFMRIRIRIHNADQKWAILLGTKKLQAKGRHPQ